MNQVLRATAKLQNYIETNKYKGYDPYDALKSPIFKLPILKKNKLIRFGTQQFLKRFPLNLRPLIFVPKGNNPVTLGLCIQAYGYLSAVYPEKKEKYKSKIEKLIIELEKMIPEGFSGACWGYDFDWEARRANIPAYQPTVVATGIISNALYEAWKLTGIVKCKELVISSSNFVLKDLNKSYSGENFCFSYSPFDHQSVLNASMKGVRILAQTYSLTKNEKLINDALPAVKYVLNYQKNDGSFIYSDLGKWIDNYHTGYVLDALDEFIYHFNMHEFDPQLNRGIAFYENHFFTSEGAPKFYSEKTFPIDCTAAAQSLLTLSRFNRLEKSSAVAIYMIKNMQKRNGSFVFRKFKNYTIKTSFMRWSDAWMFSGLSYMIYKTK